MATTLANSLRADHVGGLEFGPVCTVTPDTSVRETLRCMTEFRTGCALVIDQERIIGIFTERDFLNRVVGSAGDPEVTVRSVMTPAPITIRASSSVLSAIETMEVRDFRHLPVVDPAGRPVGVMSVKGIMHYLVQYFPANVYNLPPTPDQTQPAREGA
jgi:CBS domain-containing protein